MKKLISLILTIALCGTMLIGCGGENTSTNTGYQYVPQKEFDTLEIGEIKTKLVPDETATGTLTISDLGLPIDPDVKYTQNEKMRQSIEKYKELYPNVEVIYDITKITEENQASYAQKTITEIMAGRGADIIFLTSEMDTVKMMKAGAFADMSEYFKADENFCADEYNKAILYGGQPADKQYVIPLEYDITTILTTKENIEQTGFNIEKTNDYVTLIKEFNKIKQEIDPENTIRTLLYFKFPYNYKLNQLINCENILSENININNEKTKEFFDVQKKFFGTSNINEDGVNDIFSFLLGDKAEFLMPISMTYPVVRNYARTLADLGAEPELIPVRNINGKIVSETYKAVAVNQSSENKQNAYNFIKILMDHDMQYLAEFSEIYSSTNTYTPISIVAVKKELEYFKKSVKKDYVYTSEAFGALSEEFLLSYLDILQEIKTIEYENAGIDILKAEMEPFLRGEKSYEECIQNAQDKLEIYISE